MIQRIQSIYLLLAFILMSIVSFFTPIYFQIDYKFIYDDLFFLILFLTSGILSLISIFLYQNRKLQFVLNRVSILINLILLGLFIFQSTKLSGANLKAMKGIEMGVFLPIISVILLVLANKAIQKDENLVKSVDRIR
ncbi:MAG: DUF4293 domain-containing protein [Flavobacterium sp.]